MNTTRTIINSDGHTDIETYLQDAEGVWMWAVTQCNGGTMNNYDGYTETQAQTEARRARIDANIEQLRIRDEMIAEVAPMLGALQSAVAGTFIVDEIGVDAVDAQRWQDEGSKTINLNGYKATATASWRERHLNITNKQAKRISEYDDGLDTSIIGK